LTFVALAAAAGLFLAWHTAGTLLLIFAGLLLASVLDACVRGLAYVLPIGRSWRLAIVCTFIVLGTAWLLVWGGYNLVDQADELVRLIGDQLRRRQRRTSVHGNRAAAEPGGSAHAGPASSPRP
jgi:predicted PurR-regulated permease PerM